MTTLTQQPVSIHSPRSFHVHSADMPNQDDMEQTEGLANGSFTSHINPHSQPPVLTDQRPSQSPRHHLITDPPAPPPIDFDMEGGHDTAGFSPSPWDFDQHLPHARSATPHTSLDELPLAVTGLPPTTGADVAAATTLSIAQDGTTLLVQPVEPSPDLALADDPSMALQRHAGADGVQAPPSQITDPDAGDDDEEDSGDDDDEEEEEEDDDEETGSHAMQFYPFEEDTSVPSSEELRIIDSAEEHSALDNTYWQSRTFFDTKDPDISPGESGVIEWTVDAFNGTKENPRKDLLLRSPIVRIGQHDWRIKMLPRGHLSTDRVSAYIECLTLSGQPGQWPEDQLPIPTLDHRKLPKRQSTAAQFSILMYNPEEPRVHEFRTDAHQFQPDSPDHGWARFSTVPWYELQRRSYISRQPLLRNDKIAVKAFIRVVHDPTGCLWAPKDHTKIPDPVPMTGLQHLPAFDDLSLGPVVALWLHLRPFRNLLYQLGAHALSPVGPSGANPLSMLQAVLYRMRSRDQESDSSLSAQVINDYIDHLFNSDHESHDILQTMNDLLDHVQAQLEQLQKSEDPVASAARSALGCLTSLFDSSELQFSGSRKIKLSIVNKPTMQDVVDGGHEALASLIIPEILTIELERQVFDRKKRCWKKLLNKVRLDDEINVNGTIYILYGFAAHTGYLKNGKYASYFRPNGPGNLWYSYRADPHQRVGHPECMTMTQAVSPREGSTSRKSLEEPASLHDRPGGYGGFGHSLGEQEPIAYVVLYVRSDVIPDPFYMSPSEPWDVPQWILDDHKPKAQPPPPTELTGDPDGAATVGARAVVHGSTNGNLPYDESDFAGPIASDAQDGDVDMDDVDGIASDKQATSATSTKYHIPTTHALINYYSQPFYNGTVKYNTYQGHGHLIYLNGDEYTGTFQDGHRDGQGTMLYANGDTYAGTWEMDLHDGQGTYTEHRTGNTYKGTFKAGKKHGEGVTTWKISEEQARLCQICYSEDVDTAFYDCGHVVCCGTCARSLEACPVCRRRIRDVLKLFYTA